MGLALALPPDRLLLFDEHKMQNYRKESGNPEQDGRIHSAPRCGIVLAAGEGKRLQLFVRQLRGDTLPKQYVNFVGSRSLLEDTLHRAEMLIPPDRLFIVVSQDHLGYAEVRQQLSSRPRGMVIAQPENKETAPGVLLPLMHLHKRYPDSTVVIFPSDHFIVEADRFMAYVNLAFRVAESDPCSIVLLGMKPNEVECEYGYILASDETSAVKRPRVRRVLQFIEKPKLDHARELIRKGGLWNTMVMVSRVQTLLDLVRKVTPKLYCSFQRIWEAIGSPNERDVIADVYRNIEAINFSTGLLEKFSLDHRLRLLVVPVHNVFWSDWGSEHRLKRLRAKEQPTRVARTKIVQLNRQ
jgi:mannose-1-phosphate guanylyltransferase